MLSYTAERRLFSLLGESLREIDWTDNLKIYEQAQTEIRKLVPTPLASVWIAFFNAQFDKAVCAMPFHLRHLSGKLPHCDNEIIGNAFAQLALDANDTHHERILAGLPPEVPSTAQHTPINRKRQKPSRSHRSKNMARPAKRTKGTTTAATEALSALSREPSEALQDDGPPSQSGESTLREPINNISQATGKLAGDPLRVHCTPSTIPTTAPPSPTPTPGLPKHRTVSSSTPTEDLVPAISTTQSSQLSPPRSPPTSAAPSSSATTPVAEGPASLPGSDASRHPLPVVVSTPLTPAAPALSNPSVEEPTAQCGLPLTGLQSTLHTLASAAAEQSPTRLSSAPDTNQSAFAMLVQARERAWARHIPTPDDQTLEEWSYARIHRMSSLPVLDYFDLKSYRFIHDKNDSTVRAVTWQCRCCNRLYEHPDGITGNLVTHLYHCPRRSNPKSEGLLAWNRVRSSPRNRTRSTTVPLSSEPATSTSPVLSPLIPSNSEPLTPAEQATLQDLLRRIGVTSLP
ncbi:hypothetical protein CF326_g1547 [Tilletia indica]|nr:hypothetical protein CF326_g1547 [Tilletia indica]